MPLPDAVSYTHLDVYKRQSVGFLPTPCLIMIIVLVVCFILLYKTRYGRYVFAVGGNRNAAHVSGINTKKIICSVYILTGVLSALAGIIMTARVTSGVTSTGAVSYTHLRSVSPSRICTASSFPE